MNTQIQQKIKNIYRMLFEMATGNFTIRLQQYPENNQLDKLVEMLNNIAGKMELLPTEVGYIHPHYTYQNLVQATIILDENFIIKSFSAQVPVILEYHTDKLFELNFHEILAKQSIPLWDTIKAETSADAKTHTTVQLVFITQNNQMVPFYCTISKLLYSDIIIINSVTTILQDILPLSNTKPNAAGQNQSDAVLIQNVRDYILNNLENQLPNINELSKIFNVNEFKLKDSFRHYFNTSIYQFYTEERLKKAHQLILQTNIPLKEVAFISGYNDYINFYKAFKKRFNYAPSELKRENIE